MKSAIFIIRTRGEYFKDWLLQYISEHWHNLTVTHRVNNETIANRTLQTAYMPSMNKIVIDSSLVYEKESTGEAIGYRDKFDGLKFTLLLLEENRTEIIASYAEPFEFQFTEFIQSMIQRWQIQWIQPADYQAIETQESPPAISERNEEILRLWREGYTGSDIGEIYKLGSRTIQNIISRLRKELGEDKVPYH